MGLHFVPFPGPSSSGVWRARSLRLIAFPVSAAQFSGCTTGTPCEADGDCPEPPEVLAKKPACSLVGKVSPGLRLPPSSPYSSGCLSLVGDGLQPAISVPSFVLCAVLVVSYVRAFCVVAIPQSGMLAQVSSLWLHSGHSGPILKKHSSLCLPAQPSLASGRCRHLCCFSAGGYRWAHNLLVLTIYLFFFPVMLPSVLPRLATHSAAKVFPGVWKLLSF